MHKHRLIQAINISCALSASSLVFAAGYKIPESSLNSVALSAAYVASAHGADAAYYNPANMAFNEDKSQVEGSLSYIAISESKYDDNTAFTSILNSTSPSEEFIMPTMHYSSKEKNGMRFGFSMVSPGGLSKRWESPYGKAYAEEFTLSTIEINPTIAYKLSPKVAIGGGLRFIYAEGVVKSNSAPLRALTGGNSGGRNIKGDTYTFGYNLALSYKPTSEMTMGLTYRSKVDLDIEGEADLFFNSALAYSGGASVRVPLPASLSVAFAYDVLPKTTVEFVYDRTYWSSYEQLDFNYASSIGALAPSFDAPIPKKWTDVNAYRFGLTHRFSNQLTLMAGYAKDKSPIPTQTLGFELPSGDGDIYSIGFEYHLNKTHSFGLAYLLTIRDDITVTGVPNNDNGIDGTFTDNYVYLITMGYKHTF